MLTASPRPLSSAPPERASHIHAVNDGGEGQLLPSPPSDDEVWSYVRDDGKRFLQFSAFSRICLGSALVFLSFRGNWLLLLLPFALAVVVGGLINMIWSTQVPPFDMARHQKLRSQGPAIGQRSLGSAIGQRSLGSAIGQRSLGSAIGQRSLGSATLPSVDVFICTCGEDPLIVENTICHALGLDYEGDVTVYVLDDRASEEIHQAALRWGATYMARPNRGWMKKAGNIQYGYGQSKGDLILVLDADFAVRPDFLEHTLPYFDDVELGILQTPQFFRVSSDNWVERGAAAQQEQFYRVGLRARDKHGGAICVGTNAVYRRAALDQRGGMALLEHSEDIFTGMKVIDAGYRVDYLPLPLAAGSAPDDAAALASQQYRWARGNFALAGTPLFKRMRLTPMQRLGLWDGWIFYVTSALSPLVALFVPIVSLAEAPWLITLAPAAMLLPSLFTEFYLQPRWLHLPDGRASRRVGLISQVAHLYALRDHLTDRDQEWIPTGGKRPSGEKKGTDRIPDQITTVALWGFLAIMSLLAFRVATGWSALDLAPVGVLAAIALSAALGTTKPAVVRRESIEIELPAGGRDAFLDMVRAISIVRVMFWHGLGFWWISWAFAAMPAVFYVSGAVLAKSLLTSGCFRVIGNRLRRLVFPYYAFVALSLGLVYLAAPTVIDDEPLEVLSWLVPYRAPAPLAWEEG
ncbi:MAG: cellulose synthase (UDP-forming) [Acidimicrobiales bacterium]|jgi:cellulose synthase (UDP-forming)